MTPYVGFEERIVFCFYLALEKQMFNVKMK